MRHPRSRSFAILLLAAAAQAQAAADAPLLVRQTLVAADTLRAGRSLGMPGHVRDATWLYGSVYCLEAVTVDTRAGEVLEVATTHVLLRGIDRTLRWSAPREEAHAAADSPADRHLLLPDRIVLPRAGGGLVGLDRATGKLVWQRDDVPDTLLVVDGSLVVAAGEQRGKPRLTVLAAANGAASCNVELPAAPLRLVPGRDGIAVADATRVLVYDRTGPRIMARTAAVTDLIAGTDGWFAAVGDGFEAWTRTGERRWRTELPPTFQEHRRMAATAEGDLLGVACCPISDSGFSVHCFAANDGATRWSFEEPGLGVSHSKYWHRVQVRVVRDDVLITSQAAGGNFALRFAAKDPTERTREKFAF